MILTTPIILCYGFLYLSVLLLWWPYKSKIPVWSITLLLSTCFALVSNIVEPLALLPIISLALIIYYSQSKATLFSNGILLWPLVLLLSVGLQLHLFPGFHNLKVLNRVYISEDGIPFSLYLNFDKTLVGIFILGLTHQLIRHKKDWLLMLKQTLPRAFVVMVILMILSFAMGYIRFDPKIPSSLLLWASTNLLFVCLAEEALFRGFIQKNLAVLLQKVKFGQYIALLIAAVLFGLAHYPGGIQYIIVATVAGIGYGWIYFYTQRIEASILTHFLLNLCHFLLFTYPALASVYQ